MIMIGSLLSVLLCGCGSADSENTVSEPAESAAAETETPDTRPEDQEATVEELYLKLNGEELEVRWEDNESVSFLKDYVRENSLTAELSMYGGFEQVGSLGVRVPRDDVQTVTEAGDIMLYSGDQIVIFYGSNSWSYTRLGHIEHKTAEELRDLLGNGDVTAELYCREP